MHRPRFRHVLVAASALALTSAGIAVGAVPAGAGPTLASTPAPVVTGSHYLALGDSVAFGYRESTNLPTPDYSKPGSFVGYAEDIAKNLGLKLTNAACPGETTASLINKSAQSNGCTNHYDGSAASNPTAGGYRTLYPLHATYAGSQLHFAENFLLAHPHTRLVTLTIGANDAFLCVATSGDGCVNELAALKTTITTNVEHILKALRGKAHYAGQIVIADYYSTNYGSITANTGSIAINQALTTAANAYNAKVADVYGAFQTATAQTSGDTCAAALVTVLTGGGCGVHPSVSGSALMAQTVERKVKK